jgi:hypothetical protein
MVMLLNDSNPRSMLGDFMRLWEPSMAGKRIVCQPAPANGRANSCHNGGIAITPSR